MPRKAVTKEEFLERSIKVHKNRFSYDRVVYKNATTSVEIFCKKHQRSFWQTPAEHYRGRQGCPLCTVDARKNKLKLGNAEFIKRCKLKYGNTFDYSKVDYRNKREKVLIGCQKHGFVKVSPEDFLANRHGCPNCGNEKSAINGKGYYGITKAADRHFCGEGLLYLLRISRNNETLLKVGVTTNLSRRLRDFKKQKLQVEILCTKSYKDLNDAIIAEYYFLNEFRDFCKQPGFYFEGYTECLDTSCEQYILPRFKLSALG